MVGGGLEADALQGGDDAPERLAGVERRSRLHHQPAPSRQMFLQEPVEGRGVELAQGEIGWIGKIDDDEVVGLAIVLQPLQGVGVDDAGPSATPRRCR